MLTTEMVLLSIFHKTSKLDELDKISRMHTISSLGVVFLIFSIILLSVHKQGYPE